VNTPTTTRRDPVIDGLKFVAAGAIVMVHVAMQPKHIGLPMFVEQVAYSALYFFFMVAGYFHGPLGTRGPKWLRQRFVRLAVPYFVWSFIFVAWWNVFHLAKGWPLYFPDPVRFVFFAGAAELLWSLPWLFVCAAATELFARTPTMRRGLLVVAALVQLGVWFFIPARRLPNYAIRQYIEGARWLVMYVVGMEFRELKRVPGSPKLWGSAAFIAALVAGLIASRIAAQPTAPIPQIVMFVLNGSVALSLLAGARVGAKWFGVGSLSWGGDYLLGVYVSHGLWLAMLVRFVSATSMPVALWLVFGWAVCFAAAIGVTRLLLTWRWTRLAVT
jgi:peptidoglycan/LPS O-acetylase OafA/YrhL